MKFLSRKKKARNCFLGNGSKFLEELIKDCNGISNPIRMFSSHQILNATDHFDSKCLLFEREFCNWYKGYIGNRPYVIKKYIGLEYRGGDSECYNDIALCARVSNHSGFLKLVGCCLEFKLPVMVFANPEFQILNERGSVGSKDGPLLPWNIRLKIAKEIAIAFTYLHTAFSRIIIYRDLNPENVALDENWNAKLADFSLSVTLPEGKTWIELNRIKGNFGYLDMDYVVDGKLTEYSDVYSFGKLMLVLLLGRSVYEGKSSRASRAHCLGDDVKFLRERGEPIEFGGDSNDMRPDQMEMFFELALRCCEEKSEDRPKMIQVAKELKQIGLMEQSLDAIEIIEQPVDQSESDACMVLGLGGCKEIDKERPKMIDDDAKEIRPIQQMEQSLNDTFEILKPEMLKNGSSLVKWIRNFGFKFEIMLILTLCVAALFIALLFG